MSAALQRASRNAVILRWWAACESGFRRAARALYVAHLGVPDCELGTMDEWVQDPDTLDYLATHYAHTLQAFADDQL